MTKQFKLPFFISLFLCTLNISVYAQERELPSNYKNQISTNLLLPIFGSVDFTYERVISNKFAIGLAVGVYGDRIADLSSYEKDSFDTNYEVMPFARLYFQGTQKKSHFIEVFGSLSNVIESNQFVRITNSEDYGVYVKGDNEYTAGGLGIGYGYRFLLMDNRLMIEPQFGIRTNFDVSFILLNAALVRTGIKIGYRF